MAIKLEFISLIVPITTIDTIFSAQGGFTFFKQSYGAITEMVWHDAHICRTDGAMNWPDMEQLILGWEERGLVGLSNRGTGRRWIDYCVATSLSGPTYPCDWLEFDKADDTVYLCGKPKGNVIGKGAGDVS